MLEILTPTQMGRADQLTIDCGIPGIDLMEAAGLVLLDAAHKYFGNAHSILVLCGPGNNGGDGYVVARLLSQIGRTVDLFSPMGTDNLSGDAQVAFRSLPVEVAQIDDPQWASYDLIIDGLFGAGLTKNIEYQLADIVRSVNLSPAKVLAVDLPSGINGATGQKCGEAVVADVTATFFRCKPGHLLFPGRSHCGKIEIGQIGIENSVLADLGIDIFRNVPDLWRPNFPVNSEFLGKKSSECVLAQFSKSAGQGFVQSAEATVLSVNASAFAAFDGKFDQLVEWKQRGISTVIISASQDEIAKLFPKFGGAPSKLEVARTMARELNAVTILKGPDTAVAEPSGRVSISENQLSKTAMTDHDETLACLVVDLMAGKMPTFFAACAATWILAEAQGLLASGKRASDMDQAIKSIVGSLQNNGNQSDEASCCISLQSLPRTN